MDTEERFWVKVDKVFDGCWNWTAYVSRKGYGHFTFEGNTRRAHRVSWILEHGFIPSGLDVLHKCDNRRCVKPDHLYVGTFKDNVRDRQVRGRMARGEGHGLSKMTEENVLEIRKRYVDGGVSHRALGLDYGVKETTIWKIINRTRWVHI